MQGIEYIVYYILDTFYPWSNQLIAPLKHHCLSLLINEMEKLSYTLEMKIWVQMNSSQIQLFQRCKSPEGWQDVISQIVES